MINLVKRLKPDVFEDLGALVALFRPGPLGSGMVDEFVARKHGIKKVTYAHPLLEPILKDTYGTIVYQEQIMQVFQTLADYSLGEADIVRRMMGKKKVEEMQKQKGKFIELASTHHDMKPDDAATLFEQIEAFASYCFNRSHSAAYAFVAYQTAYLKCHFPVEYLSALLSSVSDNKDQTQLYIEEAQKYGIKVLPPDINHSYLEYTPDGENIRFGLAAIKQVGEPVVEAIIKEREENGEFSSIFDFCKRVDAKFVNKKSLEGLIKAGAFSNIEKSRKQLFDNMDHILDVTSKEAKDRAMGQVSLFAAMGAAGNIIGTIFFAMVLFAAITSAVSVMEAVVSCIMDAFHTSRTKAGTIEGIFALIVGIIVCLGYNKLYFEFKLPNGSTAQILDIMDYISNNLLMPIVALATCILVGWVIKPKTVIEEVEKSGCKMGRKRLYTAMVKVIAPIFLILLLLQTLGIMKL